MNETKDTRRRPAAEQLPLALNHDAATGRDDLLVAPQVSAALAMIDAWPAWPAPVVILTGPAGCGKSHLAQIWRDKAKAVTIDPKAGGEAASMAAEGPVLFEDADRAGFDDNELFHVINSVRENGHTLLMTARLWPMSWPVSLPDLRSRLKAATVIEIGEPDEDLLGQVIIKLFADRQLSIDDRLVAFIVSRMERSMQAATGIVERLDRLALSRGTRITRALAAEVLHSLSAQDGGD
ncbi:DnaA regulatory inactivator HdaA [Rhizobium sp. SSA_523]|uniref:DnaA regulatory inactivator HdaA n=1 Tax=Rhizobium sp. SSA_523 TaxID=2952477 RepID=UPI00209009A3|nr:DnaA regulatory inactivator HdaA [Rhizobium sp. SSA_523]MCO5730725.1 DnaA regulatory inactivator HdaA [Rhizobium sp. SSA_523]WKC24451.1 DnaA regulatory inactivator HdaA [Rhizobium sp. SSA_523]